MCVECVYRCTSFRLMYLLFYVFFAALWCNKECMYVCMYKSAYSQIVTKLVMQYSHLVSFGNQPHSRQLDPKLIGSDRRSNPTIIGHIRVCPDIVFLTYFDFCVLRGPM